ncbi:hypothetical protein [Streptomyces sp. NPDC048659]|uniref:hypothetical protein n=1 Tax=Streptomyces sp. NPDC048659 TaxID=3155489 RepID=UPI0034285C4B
MAGQDEDLVDVDPHDPGDGSLPVFRWRQAGPRLATRRQLREMSLRPGGQEPADPTSYTAPPALDHRLAA